MKLHLPKAFFTAVIAAFAVSQTVWAGDWSTEYSNTYEVTNGESIDTLSTADKADETGIFIRAGEDAVTASITTLDVVHGKTLALSFGYPDGTRDLASLTIGTINVANNGDATGSTTLNVAADSTVSTTEFQNVTIGEVKGSISTLNVGVKGHLTLGAVSGNITDLNMGASATESTNKLVLNGAANITGTATLNSGIVEIAYTGEDGITIAKVDAGNSGNARGGILVKSGAKLAITTLFHHHANNPNKAVTLENGATLVLSGVTIKGISSDSNSYGTVHRNASGADYTASNGIYTISNAQVEYNGTIGNVLTNVVLNNDTANTTLTVTNGANTISKVTASAGTINVQGAASLGAVEMSGGEVNVSGMTIGSTTSLSLTGGSMNITGSTVDGITLGSGEGTLTISGSTIKGSISSNGNMVLGSGITGENAELSGNITIGKTLSGSIKLTGDNIKLDADFSNYTVKDPGSIKYSLTGAEGSFAESTDENGFRQLSDASYWLVQGDATGTTATSAGFGEGESVTLESDNTGVWFEYASAVAAKDFYITTGDVTVSSAAQAMAESYVLNGATARMVLEEGSVSADDIVVNNIGNGINLGTNATLTDLVAADDATLIGAISGTGTIEVTSATGTAAYATSIAPGEEFAGTLYVKSGNFTYNTSNIGKTLKLGTGANFQVTAASTLAADQTIELESGNHEMHINSASGNSFTILGTVSGEGWLVRKGSGNMEAYIKDNASVSNFENNVDKLYIQGNAAVDTLKVSGGTAYIEGSGTDVTHIEATGGVVNISGATVDDFRMTAAAELNITGTSSIGDPDGYHPNTWGDKYYGIYAKVGTVNIGNGTDVAQVTTTRLQFGDTNSASAMVTANIKENATLIVTGSNNSTAYGSASILLGEWEGASTLNVAGKLLAKNAKALVGDSSSTITIENGGVVAVQGIGIADTSADKAQKTQLTNLTVEDGGKLILGSDGINCGKKGFTGVIGAGTVGMTVDMTIAENISLSSETGTTFDTTKYVWGTDGSSIEQGTEGGTMTISGNISDHTVTTTSGEGDSQTTTTTTHKGKLIVTGKGTLVIDSSNNTYSGGTSVKGGSTLVVGNQTTGALGTGDVDITEGSTLKLNWDSSLAVSAINMSGESVIELINGSSDTSKTNDLTTAINIDGTNTIKASSNGNNTVIDGSISGSGTLNLATSGTNVWQLKSDISDKSDSEKLAVTSDTNVTMSGNNTYTGGTTITGNTLKTAGENALGDGKVTVEGGTLEQTAALKVSELEYKSGTVSNAGNALEAGKLTVASGATMADAGTGTVTVTDTLTVSNADAFQLGGALVLTGATVDASGITLGTNLTDAQYVYTLGTATGGITEADKFTFIAPSVDGYEVKHYVSNADDINDVLAGIATAADTNTVNDTLYLVLTKETTTPTLTEITVSAEGSSYADGVLTLQTSVDDATAVAFGPALNAKMSDTVWDSILEQYGKEMGDFVKVSFADANGKLLDFGNDGETQMSITINGEVTRDGNLVAVKPTLSGEGTIVGNYVTAYIPEPTSTSLSILALAALAVRRRRR